MIFSRGRGSGRHDRGQAQARGRHARERNVAEDAWYAPDTDEDIAPVPEYGPYDAAEAPAGVPRLDLGSLLIPAVDGVEVRVQANPDGVIQQVILVHAGSALQLAVVAAPRSEGIWDEVRAEIHRSLLADGATAEEVDGEHGTELRARVPAGDGGTDLRFVGVDGPRWMVRAVFQGPAAVSPAKAGPLAECLVGLVVERGSEAMPVGEALPLRLPPELDQPADQADTAHTTNGVRAGAGHHIGPLDRTGRTD